MSRDYQRNFSATHVAMYEFEGRERKAQTLLAVLDALLGNSVASSRCLNIGCSTGIMDSFIAPHVGHITGIDIDQDAINYANANFSSSKASFVLGDAMRVDFADSIFDVIVCSQVYEHVPDPGRMMAEVARLLKPGGVCYFAATNRLCVIEQHYFLPFLSMLPQRMADLYLQLAGRGDHYYEKHLTYWGLRRLVSDFELLDYTPLLLAEPEQFHATYMVGKRGFKPGLLRVWFRLARWAFPGYIWILRRNVEAL